MTNTSTAHQGSQNRNYLFSPEMNVHFMNTLTSIAMCISFATVTFEYFNGDWSMSGTGIGTQIFLVITTLLFSLIALVSTVTLTYACFKAIRGVDGAKQFLPQRSTTGSYCSMFCIWSVLGALNIAQAFYFSRNPQIPNEMLNYSVYTLMLVAFAFGTVGLIRKIGLHLRYNRENPQNV